MRILHPTDGTDHADRAAAEALDRAERADATLHALYVVDTAVYDEPALSSAELAVDEVEDEAHDLLSELAGRAAERGVEAVTAVRHGRPAAEILDYAEEVDADLLVLGRHGPRHDRTDALGSVAGRVLRGTDREVVTV